MTRSELAVKIENLVFQYGDRPLFDGLQLQVPRFSRCLLLGANGVGKSTLLRLIAGKHLVAPGSIEVFGANPFSGELGPQDFTLVGERFPFELDIAVSDLIAGVDRPDFHELIKILGVDPRWRMHRVSNGQRRKVDILLSFRKGIPKLMLLDEVTSDLDILTRQDFLAWLKAQTEARKMTVLFATHILDGMERWASHVAFLSPSRNQITGLRTMTEMESVIKQGQLLAVCEKWLREDRHGG